MFKGNLNSRILNTMLCNEPMGQGFFLILLENIAICLTCEVLSFQRFCNVWVSRTLVNMMIISLFRDYHHKWNKCSDCWKFGNLFEGFSKIDSFNLVETLGHYPCLPLFKNPLCSSFQPIDQWHVTKFFKWGRLTDAQVLFLHNASISACA